jgi:hypothetical protein
MTPSDLLFGFVVVAVAGCIGLLIVLYLAHILERKE